MTRARTSDSVPVNASWTSTTHSLRSRDIGRSTSVWFKVAAPNAWALRTLASVSRLSSVAAS
jgi:hypothetical protein